MDKLQGLYSACKDVVKSTADVGKSAMPGVFNPVINSNSSGTVNLIVSLCPSGNMAVGNRNEV